MNKLKEFSKSETFKIKVKPEIIRTLAVVIYTIIYGLGVNWFLEGAYITLYTGGVPGIGQLIRDILTHQFSADVSPFFIPLFIVIVNIPILILGWFGVSKRFTIYSLISVLIQSTIIGFIPQIPLGLNTESNLLAATILGGLLVGVGVGGTLKHGTSTGGLDILAQYVSLKNGRSVGAISLLLNAIIAIGGGLVLDGVLVDGVAIVGGVVVSYTVLRILISTLVTDRIHTSYSRMSVEIITDHPQAIIDEILTKLFRGVTLVDVRGGYSKTQKTMVIVIISAYELAQLEDVIMSTDDKAFVVAKPVDKLIGNFKRKTIA